MSEPRDYGEQEIIDYLADMLTWAKETEKVWLSAMMNALTEDEARKLTAAGRRLVRAGNKRLRSS